MFCENCGNKIKDSHEFCGSCGSRTTTHSFTSKKIERIEVCQLCGNTTPVKNVNFNANIGMIFMRRTKQVKGKLCKKCINSTFWNFTLTNLFLGWWGVISFFATFAFVVGNTFQYIGSLSMKKLD